MGGKVYKSSMYDAQLIFMQSALVKGCKSFQFTIIIDFYASFLRGGVHKSFIYNV